jgi:hypothetical protein
VSSLQKYNVKDFIIFEVEDEAKSSERRAQGTGHERSTMRYFFFSTFQLFNFLQPYSTLFNFFITFTALWGFSSVG